MKNTAIVTNRLSVMMFLFIYYNPTWMNGKTELRKFLFPNCVKLF